jgi:poly(hydroxyalkanoate) depolymerase family esterase
MNALSRNILEATHLTRQGRLREAMALLRGAPMNPTDSAGESREMCGSILDMTPPQAAGGTWTAPQYSGALGKGFEGLGQRHMDGRLRSLLDRIGQTGFLRGLEDLVKPAVVRAPPPIPDGARFEERAFASAAGSRYYKLYVPSRHGGEALPLIVMLHGCMQSPDEFAAGTRMNDVAEEHTFLVAYPAQAQSANISKCWNWFNENHQRRDRGEPSIIAGITREIMDDFPVEPGHVYIAGLSAGGAAAAIMGSTYPDLYTAIGVHSGLACGAASDVPSAFAAMRIGAAERSSHQDAARSIIPTIVFHGDRDTTVNLVNGDQVITQAKAAAYLRADVIRGEAGGLHYTRTVHVGQGGKPVLEQWVLHGGGHAWSGGSALGSYTDPRGPDASREMTRFFFEQASEGSRAAPRKP